MDNKNNSGYCNSGDWNSGYWNSGYWNSGYRNSGDRNSGSWNSGYRNSGDRNSGDGNSGDWNSGYRNSGDRNSGSWNSGDGNSGYFNTDNPMVRMFGKDTEIPVEDFDVEFPGYMYFDLCVWVEESEMTNDEKKEHPEYKTLSGYLKTLEYEEAWRKAWDKEADDEQKLATIDLPNFDPDIFEEITGIDVRKEKFEGNRYNTEKQEEKSDIAVDVITVNGKKHKRLD